MRCVTVLLALAPVRGAAAQPAELSDGWAIRSGGTLTVDADFLASPATSLGPSLSAGAAVGVAKSATKGSPFAWQVRASWSSATESSIDWTASHADLRLRAGGVVQRTLGRARVGLRLGLGPTIVHEDRTRNQGANAGLSGSALETSTFATLPAADLEAVVAVHVFGPWLLVMSGGPDVVWSGGSLHGSWLAEIGVGWQP